MFTPAGEATTATPGPTGDQRPNPAPARPKWPWIAGAAVAVAVVAGGAAVFVTGSDSTSAAPTKTYTELPEQCTLISAQTLAAIAPGAVCDIPVSGFGKATSVSPTWTVEAAFKDPTSIKVTVTLSADAAKAYSEAKGSLPDSFARVHDVQVSEAIGLGDEAFVIGGKSRITTAGADAHAIARVGNVFADITFSGYTDVSTSVAGAKAALTDILAKLG